MQLIACVGSKLIRIYYLCWF